MSEFLNSSSRAKKKLSVLAVGTSQVVLSFEALKAADFDLPCKDEQDKIASFFECLNRRIEYQRTLVDALKKYKRGVVAAILSHQLKFSDATGSHIQNGHPARYKTQWIFWTDSVNHLKVRTEPNGKDNIHITAHRA